MLQMPGIDIKSIAENYFSGLKEAIDKISIEDIQKILDTLIKAYKQDNTIFIMGNGGSAATASHMACDLGKGTLKNVYNLNQKRLKVISLTDNVATMTAFANDITFNDIFSQQLRNLIRPRDVLIGISASGNSPNIIRALKYAKSKSAITIGFFGNNGGKAKEFVDLNIIIHSRSFGIIEDLHLTLSHLLTTCLAFMKEQIDFAAFIDRDGTINLDVDNLSNIKDLVILPKVSQAIALLNRFHIPAIVITNQPGVARGLLTEEEVEEIHKEIASRLKKEGAKIDGFYFCPHHPNANLKKYRVTCICRKPGTGMYQQAAKDFGVNLKSSYVVGDSFRDIGGGKALGATTIALTPSRSGFFDPSPNYLVKNLYEAVKLILRKENLM